MIVRPTRLADVERIQVRPMEAVAQILVLQHFHAMGDPVHGYLEDWAMTLEHDDDILAIGGVVPLPDGSCEIWAMLTDEVLATFKNLKALHRAAWQLIDNLETWDFDRIVAHVGESHAEGMRWMDNFGFTFEEFAPHLMPDGSTARRYARVN